MAVPAFSFTSRAVPVAQIGRPSPLTPDDVTWADIGCDVYEITTDTGRGSASDRFVPGTAIITASNATGWADAVVPVNWSYFADDFARTGPALGSHWERWPAVEADRDADVLVIDNEAATVQGRPSPDSFDALAVEGGCELIDTGSGFGDIGTSATIGPFTGTAVGDLAVVALAVHNEEASSPVTIPGWTLLHPALVNLTGTGWQYDIYTHRITAEEAAVGEPWTATWTLPAQWTWVGWVVRGVATVELVGGSLLGPWPSGFTGYYETRVYTEFETGTAGSIVARIAAGNGNHGIVEGGITELVHSTYWDSTLLLAFDDGGAALPVDTFVTHRTWNWTSGSAGSEWSVGNTLLFTPGPAPDPASVPMEGASTALWGLAYEGDQFIDTLVTGLAAPDKVWPNAHTRIDLALHANAVDLAASVATFYWVPSWDDPDVTGTLYWSLARLDAAGDSTTLASGSVVIGPDGFPEPARFRFEADTAGPVRAYFQGALLGSGSDLSPPTGDLIGIFAEYYAGALSYGRTHQPGPPRIESVTAGSNIPVPILLEPGVRVRIGVHHQTYGDRWFFHGYVDGIIPVYDPAQPHPVSRIECIDPLGEVGRLPIHDIASFDPEEAAERVQRLLAAASWPDPLSEVYDDATWMSNRETADTERTVDYLTQTAESCGGAVYGDPQTGKVVFRGRDWQAWDPDAPPDGYITNGPLDLFDSPEGLLAVCPSTWERSWKREEMSTRAELRSGYGEVGNYSNPDAEARYGVESYNRTLVAVERRILDKLGNRQLRLRGPGAFPRVAAVLLDAATGNGAVDVMTVSTFTQPYRYQCGLVRDGTTVFDRQYFVTGVRHTISRDRWQCRLALDVADVFATKGARWGRGHWGRSGDVWGESI